MSPFYCAIFLLVLSSLATAANFNQVNQWDELDFEWPSEESRTQALEDRTFKPEDIQPRFMSVQGGTMSLSLYKHHIRNPVSLVSLPTSSVSSALQKLTPIPSWDMHISKILNCTKIEEAKGQRVDFMGRLWVLDSGSANCNAKLWTIDSANNNQTKLIHRFSFDGPIHDLVLDETPEGTFAYIMRLREEHIVVFSLERNVSWIVNTPEISPNSIALSPKTPKNLYLSHSNRLYSIPVAKLRHGTQTVTPKLVGHWNAEPYSMLIDNEEIMFAAFIEKNYISVWNTSQPFEEQRFYQVDGLNTSWPFTLALDENGTTWILVCYDQKNPKYVLLKLKDAAVLAQPSKLSREFNSGEENVSKSDAHVINSSGILVFILAMAILRWRAPALLGVLGWCFEETREADFRFPINQYS